MIELCQRNTGTVRTGWRARSSLCRTSSGFTDFISGPVNLTELSEYYASGVENYIMTSIYGGG